MKLLDQKSPKKPSTAWHLAEIGFDVIGSLIPDSIIGLLLLVALITPFLLIKYGRSIFHDW